MTSRMDHVTWSLTHNNKNDILNTFDAITSKLLHSNVISKIYSLHIVLETQYDIYGVSEFNIGLKLRSRFIAIFRTEIGDWTEY